MDNSLLAVRVINHKYIVVERRNTVAAVGRISKYSRDYRELSGQGKFQCTVAIDYDKAMSFPDMDKRTYYKKDTSQEFKERLNRLGIHIVFLYDINTGEILQAVIKFESGCMVVYAGQQIEDVVEILESFHSETEQ